MDNTQLVSKFLVLVRIKAILRAFQVTEKYYVVLVSYHFFLSFSRYIPM